MTTEADRKKHVQRVRALLTKATDPGATEAEAEAFTAKAQDLMERWAIADAELAVAGRSDQRITTEVVAFVATGVYAGPLLSLAASLDQVYDTQTVASRRRYQEGAGQRGGTALMVTGFSDDVENYKVMWESLTHQLDIRLASAEVVALMQAETAGTGRAAGGIRIRWKNAYTQGFARGAVAKLLERKRMAREGVDTSTALVLVGKRDQVDAAVRDQYGRLGTGRGSQSGGGFAGAKGQGYSDGQRASTGERKVAGSRAALR